MDSLCYFFGSAPATCKLTGCGATSFPGLEKHVDDIKDSGKRMDSMYLIKTADPQFFSHLWNELEKGTIFGKSTNVYPSTISNACDVLIKYKTP